ncbi:MAG: BamA/TamA family outer membrane protein, partial [Myxococcota bacterium]
QAYPRAEIRVEEMASTTPGQVDIRYHVVEDDEVSFGQILIQGNFKTDDWVIRDELGFRPGEPLSLLRAEIGQQNLRSSGLFNTVQVAFLDLEDGNEDAVNVVVQVEERHDYRLALEAALGVSSDRGLVAEAGMVSPNILGQGLRGELRGEYATELSSTDEFFLAVEGKLILPRWITRRLTGRAVSPRLETTAFWRQEPTERFGELTSYGFGLAVSKLGRFGLFKDWLLSVRYDLRQRNRDEQLNRVADPSEDIEQAKVRTRTGAIGPVLIIDKRRDDDGRPNPLAPTRGFKLEARMLVAHRYLAGQDNFIKIGLGGQHFWKPRSRLVISNGLRYDQGLFPFGGVALPEVERFFAGGDTTVRGFEEDRLAVEELLTESYPGVTRLEILPAGGNLRFIHNLDVQIEVGQMRGIPVASAVFLDTGLVTNSLDGFQITELRHSLGVALIRWVTPFSSLSLEWAIPLDPRTGDNPRGRYHLNLGLLF